MAEDSISWDRATDIRNVSCRCLAIAELTQPLRRWLRLLFTRELNMQDAMVLWDGLFACDPTFEIVEWICVAMLIRIRNRCEAFEHIT